MKTDTDKITRRDFMKKSSKMTVMASMGLVGLPGKKLGTSSLSRVVLVRDKNVVNKKRVIYQDILAKMLDKAIMELVGETTPRLAWKNLVTPTDIVGIKSNEWGPLPTPQEIEQYLAHRIRETGVPAKNLSAADRSVLNDKVFLNSTALINVRPLRTHHWAGIGGCIKNYIMFVKTPWLYHGNACESLGAIWKLPIVRNKTRLNILVVLTPLFHGIGAHHFDMKYTWRYNGILVSKDPVAIDLVGLHIIKAKREHYFGKNKPLVPPVTFIRAADKQYNIGVSDMKNVHLVKLGWKDGILI